MEEEKKIEKRKFNFIPFEIINFSKFDEMRKQLDEYFVEIYESLVEEKLIEGEGFKKSFFTSLENLLVQICLIKDEKIKVQKIDDVYKWYKNKMKLYSNISGKSERKIKKVNSNFPDSSFKKEIKDINYNEKNIDDKDKDKENEGSDSIKNK
mgnify:CR=1 FL=1